MLTDNISHRQQCLSAGAVEQIQMSNLNIVPASSQESPDVCLLIAGWVHFTPTSRDIFQGMLQPASPG